MGDSRKITRRQVLGKALKCTGAAALGGAALYLGLHRGAGASPAQTVWQIDPEKCTGCGQCATACVRRVSPVKCVHAFAICGYCDLCFGYLQPQFTDRDTAAENQLCPTGAIQRTFVEDPYYSYTVDQSLCIGCGKCVKGCTAFGNGSLFLQVIHGDMSFPEWLRAEGEEKLAAKEDDASMVARAAERAIESVHDQEGLLGRAKAHLPMPTTVASFELDNSRMPKEEQDNILKRNALHEKYKSELGRIPRCLNCNECSIAVACPARAFVRMPSNQPYLLKKPKGPA